MNLLKQLVGAKTTNQLHGRVFDWMVMIISTVLSLIFSSLGDFVKSGYTSKIILFAFILYLIGSLLKHLPLGIRLASTNNENKNGTLIAGVYLFHFCVMIFVATFSADGIGKITGWFDAFAIHDRGLSSLIIIFLLIISTIVLFYSGRPYETSRKYSEVYLQRREWIADFLLILSVGVFTFIFWDQGAEPFIKATSVTNIGMVLPKLFLIGFCYFLFYLPFRILFLLEDGKDKTTWSRMWTLLLIVFARSIILTL